ncbi:MAG: recombinase family protein [Firmicutes bacterium]|nr:recombinase family protein [Bacillota bacterium]
MLASNVKVIQPRKLFNIEESARQLLRVAGYARVSTGRPEQKTSFESQQKHYKELVAKHSDWIDVGLYADEGITATSMRKRKQFLKMIQDAKEGKIDRIIVKSVSRFARNTVDCLATVEELTALGVDVFFELQNLSSLQDSKTTRMQLTMYASMAQEESETLSESVAYGIREGIKNGRYRAPKAYGYRLDENKRLVIDPEQAEVIMFIYNTFLQGYTVGQICAMLNAREIPAPRGGVWYDSTVDGILKNEKYIGDLRLEKTVSTDLKTRRRVPNINGQQFYVTNNHEGILAERMFKRVQAEIEYRQNLRGYSGSGKSAYTTKYPFSNKLFCGRCGSKYRRHSYDLKRKDENGNPKIEKVYTWVCINHKLNKKTACPQTQVKESSLEKAFIAALNTIIEDQDGFVKTVIANISEVLNTRLSEAALEGNRGRYEAKQKELQNVLANSLKSPTAENARLYERLVQELESLKLKIETEEGERSKTLMSKTRAVELEQFINSSKLFHEFDEMVFRKLVERVIVNEDSVTFKFTDFLEREVPLIE